MCDRCAGAEPGSITLSADALGGIALLLTRPLAEAGEFVELKRAGEILRVVEAFLIQHFQRFRGLRSLELLRSLPEPRPTEDPPCPS